MTPEEIERTTEFILRHEAELSARMDRLGSAVESLEKTAERHDREISQLTDLVGHLAQAEIRLVGRMDELAASHKEMGERLNALIVTVERYIASRNGGPA
jgi:chromosome segregation ATPase